MDKCWHFPNGAKATADGGPDSPPDYFNDLNACHEMEEVLTEGERLKYNDRLYDAALKHAAETGKWRYLSLKASYRAEAFGLTLGLWKEGNV